MQTFNRPAERVDPLGSFPLFVLSPLLQLPVKRPSVKVFQQKVDVLFVIKNGVDSHDVGVTEGSLDPDLKSELVNH